MWRDIGPQSGTDHEDGGEEDDGRKDVDRHADADTEMKIVLWDGTGGVRRDCDVPALVHYHS